MVIPNLTSQISHLKSHISNLKSHISHRISHISCMAYATLITDGDFFLLEAFAAEVELPRYRCCKQDIKCNHQQRSRISQYSHPKSHISYLNTFFPLFIKKFHSAFNGCGVCAGKNSAMWGVGCVFCVFLKVLAGHPFCLRLWIPPKRVTR